MKRLFIAVDIEPGTRLSEEYEYIRSHLRLEKINWTDIRNLHITLAFLGDTPEEILPSLIGKLEQHTGSTAGFALILSSLGVFRNLHDPRVLWMGCVSPGLELIKDKTVRVLGEFGYRTDVRGFSPHLTLGRIKEIRQINPLLQLITRYKDTVFHQQKITRFLLFESLLRPEGPVYKPLHVFPLIGEK